MKRLLQVLVIEDSADDAILLEIELQRAAVSALVKFSGSNAVAVLSQHINTNFLSLRYDIVRALADQLHQPMEAEWLLPVLMGREYNNTRGWMDSLRLLRLYGGEKAIPTMLSCVDYDVAWSDRNWWILEQGVKPCPNSPQFEYEHDPNSDGTPEQWTNNLRVLQMLKPLAGSIPVLLVQPKKAAVPYLITDPPIDFTPTFREVENGGVEIKSGFFSLTISRGGAQSPPYSVSEAYRSTYEVAGKLRHLAGHPELNSKFEITAEQAKQLTDLIEKFSERLCGSDVSKQAKENFYNLLVQQIGCPHDIGWWQLLFAYKEAPAGLLKEQAKSDLVDSVRQLSQNYHVGTVEFAEAAKKIFTPEQLAEILR